MSNGMGAAADVAGQQAGSIEQGPVQYGRNLQGEFFIDPADGKVKDKPKEAASVTPAPTGGDQSTPRHKIGEKELTEEELVGLLNDSVPKGDFTRLRQKDNQQLDEERQKLREELEKEYAPLRQAKELFDTLPAHVRDQLMKKDAAGIMSQGQAENMFAELMKEIDPQSAEGRAVDTLGRALTAQIMENRNLQQALGSYEQRLISHDQALSYTVLSAQAREVAADLKAAGIDFPREQQRFLIKAVMSSNAPINEETMQRVWEMTNPGKAAKLQQQRGAMAERQQIEGAAANSTTPGGSPAQGSAGTAAFSKEEAVRMLEQRYPDRADANRVRVPFAVG